jgi:hypothetical protein
VSTSQPAALRPFRRPEGWWAYPLIYPVAAYIAASVPTLQGWAFVVIGLAVGGFGALGARLLFPARDYGRAFTGGASWCAGLAGITAGFWMLIASPTPLPLAPWLLVWFGVFGSWYYLLGLAAPRVAAAAETTAGGPAPAGAEQPIGDVGPYPGILTAAQVTDVRVSRVSTSPSGGVETVHLRPVRHEGKKLLTYGGFLGDVPAIATEAAMQFEETRGIDLEDQDVVPERGRNMGEFLLHFTVKRVHEGPIPFVWDHEPTDADARMLIGRYEDDRPIELQLCHPDEGARHLDIVGKTGSGKGVLLAVLIARLTASKAGEVWLVGTEKLVKLAWGWVLPWLRGEVDRPAVDRVGGESLDEALAALADALLYAKLCNQRTPTSGARKAEPGRGMLTVIVDEASKVLGTTKKWPVDGRMLTASEMVAEIKALGRTALVNVVIANQDQLFSSFGAAGSGMQRNTDIGIALYTKRRDDADKVLAGLPGRPDASKLRNKQFYVTTGEPDERGMRGKALSLLDDEIPLVAARNAQWRFGLDPDVTKDLRTYADRWNPRRHRELVEAARLHGLEWPMSNDHPGGRPEPTPEPTRPPAGDPPAPERVEPAGAHPAAEAGDPHPDLPPADLPPGWDDDARLWAELLGEDPGAPGDQGGSDAPAPGGMLPAPDTSGIEAAGRRLVEAMRQHAGRPGHPPLPEPLDIVMLALGRPGAPAEWVATQRLAEVIGRVDRDAEPEAKRRAAEQLGRDLSALDANLRPTEPRRAGGQRLRGFLVADLRAAAARLSRGAA